MIPDFHSPAYSHSRRRRSSCPPQDGDQDTKGSLLPIVVLLGGVVFAMVIWKDRKRVREAGGAGEHEGRPEQSDNVVTNAWHRVCGWFWKPGPSLNYKGRACGALQAGEESGQGGEGGVNISEDTDELAELTNVGLCTVQKFEDGRWHVLSRSAPCHFILSSGPSPSPSGSSPQSAARQSSAKQGVTGRCAWRLHVGSARNPHVEADVSGELQLREAPGEAGVKFKWDGGFWSLQFPNKSALSLFLSAFRAKQQASRSLFGAPSTSNSTPQNNKRPGGDVKIEDILS